MTMKKITLALLGTFCLASAFGQRIGVHAAALLSSQSVSFSGLTLNSDSRFGWKAGLVGEVGLGSGLRFMPQLNVVSKGSKFTVFDEDGAITSKTNLTYIEVPLLLTYNTPVGLFLGAGPSFAFGIGGKETLSNGTESASMDVRFDGNTDPDDDFSHYKRADIGGQVLAGFHLPKGFFINAHYSFGLSNIAASESENGKIKNRYFGFGIGKFFGK
jgi:hypothetical protein